MLYINQLAVVATCGWAFLRYHRARWEREYPQPHESIAIVLGAAEAALFFGPYMVGIRELEPFKGWWLSMSAQVCGYRARFVGQRPRELAPRLLLLLLFLAQLGML